MKQLSLYMLATLLLFSCRKDINDDNNTEPEIPKGTLTGKVVTANNSTPVKHAIVFTTVGSTVYHTYTDINGLFSLKTPAGPTELHIQSGSGKIFRTKLNVTVEANKTTPVASSAITLNQVASLAFVPGTYDKIQAIVIDSLGYTATAITAAALQQLSAVSQFNAIFINCSSNMAVNPTQDTVLATYVANGGSLYISDFAVATLIGSMGSCPRQGGFIPDSLLCTQRNGAVGTINNAPIASLPLQTYLNKLTMNVKYDLGSWEAVIFSHPTFWEVMVKHPTTLAPLLLRTNNFTNASAGTVNVGAGNNTNMVTICHKPQGSNPITITIPTADLAAHMAHGDSLGSCQSANGAGRIYYTTFHTEPNGHVGPDMKQILDFIILNL